MVTALTPPISPRHRAARCSGWSGTRRHMKTVSPSDVREPLYTFRCPKLGYDIVMIPHSEQDRVRLKREAKRKGMSLVEFARDQLLDVLVSCRQIE